MRTPRPEQTRLTLANGQVSVIDRVRGSSELPAGQQVLDDDHLRELGALLWQIRELFSIDEFPPPDSALLLDAEWKLRPDDTLLLEQVRPYLRRE